MSAFFGASHTVLRSFAFAAVFLAAIPASAAETADPLGGQFALGQAMEGIPEAGPGTIVATLQTSSGTITCELFEKQAPIAVANFIGLARGLRPWQDPESKKWLKKRFYDGLIFHRVVPGFMIQGGDPLGTGTGSPGYSFQDEYAPGLKFDRAGILAMANRGPGTNGSQFFITVSPAMHLTGHKTIFGQCQPAALITQIATAPSLLGRPATPVVIQSVTISRVSARKAGPADLPSIEQTSDNSSEQPTVATTPVAAAAQRDIVTGDGIVLVRSQWAIVRSDQFYVRPGSDPVNDVERFKKGSKLGVCQVDEGGCGRSISGMAVGGVRLLGPGPIVTRAGYFGHLRNFTTDLRGG